MKVGIKANRSYSITTKLILSVLLLYAVLAFVFLPWQMLSAYHEEQDNLTFELKRLQNIVRPGLSDAAWRGDDDEVESLLESVLHSTDVLGVHMERYVPIKTQWREGYSLEEVTHLDYRIAALRQVTGGLWPKLLGHYAKPVVQEFSLIRERASGQSSEVIGKVQFYSNTAVIIEAVRLNFIDILFRAIARVTLLSLFLLWIGYWCLTKPLKALMQATDSIARGELDQVARQLRQHRMSLFKTEIDELIDAFQNMAQKVILAQRQVERARAHLTEIFNTSPSAMIAIDAKGLVTEWNRKAEHITNVTRIEALGVLYSVVYPPLKIFHVTIQKALTERQAQIIKKKQLDNHHYFDIFVSPLEQVENNGAVIRLDDVTEQVKMQEITMQTEKMTSVGLLAAGMAHEINNPLGAVLQSTQNIGRRLDPDLEVNVEAAREAGIDMAALVNYLENRGIYKFLRSIKESGERAAKIVANLLQFSRRTAGTLQMLKPQNMIEKALELAHAEKRLFDPKATPPMVIKKEYADDLPYIMGNEGELEQVMLNLIKNAGQALLESAKTTREITINASATKEAVIIKVSDNGLGMDDIVKNRIFEPFFTTKPIGEGTGLGLSVCYRIITESHNGKIYVDSILGEGSTFTIELPIWQAEQINE